MITRDFNGIQRQYDAGLILCGGLREVDGQYFPTTALDEDQFGMLFGEARVWAAAELRNRGIIKELITVGGVSDKQKEKFGPNVPEEGRVYARAIADYVAELGGSAVKVAVVGAAYNTWSELEAGLTALETRGELVGSVAIISNLYHTMLRVPRMVHQMQTRNDRLDRLDVRCLHAENILHELDPGKYDPALYDAYKDQRALGRYMRETEGFWDLVEGRYHTGEFQHAEQSASLY